MVEQMADDGHTGARTKTTFQIHVSQSSGIDMSNIIDFTEQRLLVAASKATSQKVRNNIMTLLRSYRSGNVTVAWAGGQPVFHRIEPRKRAEQKLDPASR